LGLDSGDSLVLVPDVTVPAAGFSLQDAIEAATERSSTVLSARTDLKVAQINLERATADGVAPLDLRLAEIAVKRAELELSEALKSVENSVISAYQAVSSAADSLKVEDSRLAAAIQRHDVIMQQFNAGLRTKG